MNGTRIAMSEIEELRQIDSVLKQYLMPIEIFFGLAGNSLSAILFKRFHNKEKNITPLLSAVAIADIGYLFSLLLTWLNGLAIEIYEAPGLCQIKVFCSHYFAFLSFWYLVWIVFLIMLSLVAPDKYHALRSSGMASLCLVGISVFSFTGHLYKTWTYGSVQVFEKRYCTLLPENEKSLKVLNVFDTVFMQMTPSFVFFVFHLILIMRCIRLPLTHNAADARSTADSAEEYRIVLTLTIVYQICILPNIISSVFSFVAQIRSRRLMLLFNIIQQPFYAYFALKPVVYVVLSSGYRQAFVSCLKTFFSSLCCHSSMSRVIAVPTEETTTV